MKTKHDFSAGKRGAVISASDKTRITIHLDTAVLDAFRARAAKLGKGYQSLINDALRSAIAPHGELITGTAHAEITLSNAARADLPAINAVAKASSGVHLCIPEHVVQQLHLRDSGTREFQLPDGSTQQVRYVSPVCIELCGRVCFAGALVIGHQILLGTLQLDDLDLIVDQQTGKVTPDPASHLPRSRA